MWQSRVFEYCIVDFSITIPFGKQENNLLANKPLLLETGFSAVKEFDHFVLLELPFERLDHRRNQAPILVAAYTACNFRLLNAHVCDYRNGFVIVLQVAERGPFLV